MSEQIISKDIVDLGKPIEELFPKLAKYDTLYEGGFTWHINNWSSLEKEVEKTGNKRIISPIVEKIHPDDTFSWKFLLYPKGNNDDKTIAIYLSPEPIDKKDKDDWSLCVQFCVFFSRPSDNSVNIGKVSYFRFSQYDTDWGFSDMMNIIKFKTKYEQLKESAPTGLLEDNENINITCYMRVINDKTGVTWHTFKNYDSKKTTNYIGFQNQGATCYLNSLLQTYFILQKFRAMVYKIDTSMKKDPTNHVDLALQRLFYNLETSPIALNTVELTKSFGWDSGDSFVQNDIQELNRLLLDKLEDSMDLKSLFVGEMKSYIKCINVDYESSRTEEFWDIQLNVKNKKNIQESFDYYIEEEILEGENSYFTEKYGLQEAKKGVIFKKLPTILFIQLKRFEYNFALDKLAKINDCYEFSDTLDLTKYLELPTGDEIYKLHGVLVHSGDLDTGHYYAILKPKDTWMCFDDDKVWRVGEEEVFEENFGFPKKPDEVLRRMTKPNLQKYLMKRQTSAYMLVYIKEDKCNDVLQDVTEDQLPSNVVTSISEEKEAEIKYQEQLNEMKLKYKLKIMDSHKMSGYRGFDLFANPDSKLFHPDFDETSKLEIVKVSRDISVEDLKKIDIFKGKNIWTMGYTKSQGLRINKIILKGHLKDYLIDCLDSFIFVEDVLDPMISLDKEFLVFVKTFGKEEDKNLIIPMKASSLTKIYELYNQMLEKNNFVGPVCIEEIGPNELERLDMDSSLLENEIGNGDIIAFGENALDVYKEIRFRLKLRFKPCFGSLNHKDFIDLETMEVIKDKFFNEEDSEISIWVNGNFTYKELSEVLGEKLGVDSKKLRICADYENKKIFMKSKSVLKDYLIKNYSFDTIPEFNFQILNTSLSEFESMKTIKVKWFTNSYIHSKQYEIKLLRSNTVKDLKDSLKQKLDLTVKGKELSTPDIIEEEKEENEEEKEEKEKINFVTNNNTSTSDKLSTLTLWTNNLHQRFTGILTDDVLIDEIGPNETICARELSIKEENKNIVVIQCFKSLNNTHGISFVFQLIPNENYLDTLDRLNDIFGLGKKEFSKIKFSSFSHKTNSTINISNLSNADLAKLVPFDLYESSDIFFMDHPDRLKTLYTNRQMSIR
ncbi:hypothetical protein ACO0SA_002159 [Hanseniaspora valbyensis]